MTFLPKETDKRCERCGEKASLHNPRLDVPMPAFLCFACFCALAKGHEDVEAFKQAGGKPS
jgi:hypothetical protein